MLMMLVWCAKVRRNRGRGYKVREGGRKGGNEVNGGENLEGMGTKGRME